MQGGPTASRTKRALASRGITALEAAPLIGLSPVRFSGKEGVTGHLEITNCTQKEVVIGCDTSSD